MDYNRQELEQMTKEELVKVVLDKQARLTDKVWSIEASAIAHIAEDKYGDQHPDTAELEQADKDFLHGKFLHAFRYLEVDDYAYIIDVYLSNLDEQELRYVLAYARKLAS